MSNRFDIVEIVAHAVIFIGLVLLVALTVYVGVQLFREEDAKASPLICTETCGMVCANDAPASPAKR